MPSRTDDPQQPLYGSNARPVSLPSETSSLPIGAYDLGGLEWRFGDVPSQPLDFDSLDLDDVNHWLPADVPGNVRSDLLSADRIPNPFYGCTLNQSAWVEQRDWWYCRSIVAALNDGQRAFIIFKGIDYISAVFAGNQQLGRREGMFSQQRYEVTHRLKEVGQFDLGVRIWGSASLPTLKRSLPQRLLRHVAGWFSLSEIPYPDRLATLKCPMSYGWDFAPRLLCMGIWDDVSLKVSGPAAITDVHPSIDWPPEITSLPSEITLQVALEIDSAAAGQAMLILRAEPQSGEAPTAETRQPLYLFPGRQRYRARLSVRDPLWWSTWDMGCPHLYTLCATLIDQPSERLMDRMTRTIGIRRIRFLPTSEASVGSAPWTWEVNGRRVYIRGLNWVPADSLPGRLRENDYQELVGQAKECGANLLRVWGGGLREKRAFYETCDRAGILVWQEFPFACVFLGRYPRDETFLQLVRQEAGEIVRGLRHHPSVALWCGGNEFSPRRNQPLIQILQQVTQEFDGSRPFLPASPGPGDRHNWDIWHGMAPAAEYLRDHSPFTSELGLQAVPDIESLQAFIPPGQLWPAGEVWNTHHAQMEKLEQYARAYSYDDLESFIRASQSAQARALQVAIEHYRRRKGSCGGLVIWQFNEPWPAISWSLFDYFRRPKLAGRLLKRWYHPLLVSLAYDPSRLRRDSTLSADVWVINDRPGSLSNCQVTLSHGQNKIWQAQIDVAADAAQRIGSIQVSLDDQSHYLRAELWQGRRLLAENDYDLSFRDAPTKMSTLRRLRRRLAVRLLR